MKILKGQNLKGEQFEGKKGSLRTRHQHFKVKSLRSQENLSKIKLKGRS